MHKFKLIACSDFEWKPAPGYRDPYGPAGNRLSDREKHECDKLGMGVNEYLDNTRRQSRRRQVILPRSF